MEMKPGKRLGGKPPRRGGSAPRRGRRRTEEREGNLALLGMLAAGLFVLGGVAGFGWQLDRELRGGLLRQQAVAQQRGDWVEVEELPPYVPAAFVAVVDPSFLQEGAVRTGETGTTLARELTRQVHLLPNSLRGEARELMMGPILEQRTGKRELLELYLNRAYLGEAQGFPLYGVRSAAREYFGKDPRELTLGETATLAGLLLSPRIEDPERSVGSVGVRRGEVLRVLLLGGVITPEEFRAAASEPLAFQPGLDELPMTRPLDLGRETVIRLPENLRPRPDSLAADSAAAGAA